MSTAKKTQRPRGLPPRHEDHINHTTLDDAPRGNGRNLRNYEPAPVAVWVIATRPFTGAHFATFSPELVERCLDAACPPDGGRVLDPFGGSGTVGMVCRARGINCTLIELSPESVEIAKNRLAMVDVGKITRRALKVGDPLQPNDLPIFGGSVE